MRTAIRTETNRFAEQQDLLFAERRALPAQMRTGCERAILGLMIGERLSTCDLGLGDPVTVSRKTDIEGQVAEAVCLIAHRSKGLDAFFFVYRSRRRPGLAAVMGASYEISCCLDGYLDDVRYYELAWDPEQLRRQPTFRLPDLETLYADDRLQGVVAGALLEGKLLSVSKLDAQTILGGVAGAVTA